MEVVSNLDRERVIICFLLRSRNLFRSLCAVGHGQQILFKPGLFVIRMEVSIKVATLNFTGINNSPFEYHDGSSEKSQINSIFNQLLKEQPEFNQTQFAWGVGKIDTVLQKERYSVAYRSDTGVIRGKLVNREQFDFLWDHYYEISEEKVAKMNLTEANLARCKLFDWLAYLALVTSVFGKVDLEKIKECDAKIFKQKLKEWHSKAYLKVKPKMDKIVDYILNERLSVLFLQQAGFEEWDPYIPAGYRYKKRASSMIIYSSNFVDEPQSEFAEKYDELLNFNQDSVYVKSKDHLFISAHLTSKSTNVLQAEEMYKVLDQILQQYPNLKIIIGMDANHFIKAHGKFHRFPESDKDVTTRKKRTYIQLQYNKSNKLVEEVKDLLVTNLSISKGKIQTIQEKPISGELIPNDSHPYDHFVVKGSVVIHYQRAKSIGSKRLNTPEMRDSAHFKGTPKKSSS